MANNVNFTKLVVDEIDSAPVGKRVYYNDTRVSGLQLQVTDKGTKTFYVYRRINGRPKRVKLGRHPDMAPARAREEAKICLGQIAAGEDPAENRRRERAETVTLAEAFSQYLEARELADSTRYNYTNFMNRAFGDWQKKQLKTLTKEKVAQRHQKLGESSGHYYANSSMRVLRAVYTFAAHQYEGDDGNSLLPPNPVRRISDTRAWFREKRRDRFITEPELAAWFHTVLAHKEAGQSLAASTVADYLLLMILSGLRKQEAATLSWSNVDLDNKTLTVRDTKNHEDHTLPLSDYLYELLLNRQPDAGTDWVFPSERTDAHIVEPRVHVKQIAEASGVPFTIHVLRHTFLTYADRLDLSAYAMKRLANHKMNNDVTAGYIGSDVERLRKPMQAITDYILKAGGVRETPVIQLNAQSPEGHQG